MKLIEQAPGDRTTQAKGQYHAGEADAQSNAPVGHEHADVDLEADEEQEQHEADIGDQIQVGHGRRRKDGILEARDAHHHRGAQNDAADDLRDNARLAQLGERVMQQPTEDDDDAGLEDTWLC